MRWPVGEEGFGRGMEMFSLSLFHAPPQRTMSRVFIGDGLPCNPRNLHRNALQRLDSWNITRIRPYFYTMQWVTAGFPLCSRACSRTSSFVRAVFATVAETTQEAPLRSSSHIVARDLCHRGQTIQEMLLRSSSCIIPRSLRRSSKPFGAKAPSALRLTGEGLVVDDFSALIPPVR